MNSIFNTVSKSNPGKSSLKTGWLYALSVIVGVFVSTFDVYTHANYLKDSTREQFAFLYILGAVAGMLTLQVYVFSVRRLKEKAFLFLGYLSAFMIVAGLYVFTFHVRFDHVEELAFILIFPLNTSLILLYWRTCRGQSNKADSRVLLRKFNIALSLGLIIGGLLVSAIQAAGYVAYTFLFCAVLAFVNLVLAVIISLKGSIQDTYDSNIKFVPLKRSMFLFFRSKYTFRILSYTVLFSMVYFIVHFAFIDVAWSGLRYESYFVNYYGAFYAVGFALVVFFDRVVIPRILFSYDSPYSIVTFPSFIIIAVLMATLIVSLVGLEVTVQGVAVLLLMFTSLKLVLEIGKISVHQPVTKTVFVSMDIRYRQIAIPKVDGNFIMIGMMLSGILLLLLVRFGLYKPIYLFATLGVFSIVWLIVASKIGKGYTKTLNDEVQLAKKSAVRSTKKESIEEKVHKMLIGNDINKIQSALTLLRFFSAKMYTDYLKRTLAHPNIEVKRIVLSRIDDALVPSFMDVLSSYFNAASVSEKDQFHSMQSKVNSVNIAFNACYKDLIVMVHSKNASDRLIAAEYIHNNPSRENLAHLLQLCRDMETVVKEAAVKAMARLCESDYGYLYVEHLHITSLNSYLEETLVKLGDENLEHLERLYQVSMQNQSLLLSILDIYGRIRSARAYEILLGKLEQQSAIITNKIITVLIESNFSPANVNDKNRILRVLHTVLTTTAQNIYLNYQLLKSGKHQRLQLSISQEIEGNYDKIFSLLSLVYHRNIIARAREIFYRGNREENSHMIELIDHTIQDEIKGALFPFFEDLKDKERIKKLQFYFPFQKLPIQEAILSVLTRDYSQLALYPRACAMLELLKYNYEEPPTELVFCLYHREPFMYQTAAYVLESIEKGYLFKVQERIDSEDFVNISTAISEVENGNYYLLLEQLEVLRGIELFQNMKEDELLRLVQCFTFYKYSAGGTLNFKEEQNNLALCVIASGKIDNANKYLSQEDNRVLFSEILINKSEYLFDITEDTEIFAVSKKDLEKLITDNEGLVNSILEIVRHI